jgi:hypothetical protein
MTWVVFTALYILIAEQTGATKLLTKLRGTNPAGNMTDCSVDIRAVAAPCAIKRFPYPILPYLRGSPGKRLQVG